MEEFCCAQEWVEWTEGDWVLQLINVSVHTVIRRQSPLQEVHILRVFDESSSHHDRLKALPVYGPQLYMDESWNTHSSYTSELKQSELKHRAWCVHVWIFMLIFNLRLKIRWDLNKCAVSIYKTCSGRHGNHNISVDVSDVQICRPFEIRPSTDDQQTT